MYEDIRFKKSSLILKFRAQHTLHTYWNRTWFQDFAIFFHKNLVILNVFQISIVPHPKILHHFLILH
jgi:hypothetical protein